MYGLAASGNGLVFAVLRTTSNKQADAAKVAMVHHRAVGATLHLLTPFGPRPQTAAGGGGGGGAAAAAAPLALPPAAGGMAAAPPPPAVLPAATYARGVVLQAPAAAALWDLHALAMRAGLVAAAALPQPPEEAWDRLEAGGDDSAALAQLQGTVGAGWAVG